MELLGILALVVLVVYLFINKNKRTDTSIKSSTTILRVSAPKSSSSDSTSGGKSFLPPIPSGYQIYVKNPSIAGIQYRKAEAVRFARASNQELTLEREPANPHDPNAIKLIGLSGSIQYFLGYIPKDIAEQIVSTGLFDSVQARLARIYIGYDDYLDIQYQIIGPKTEKKRFEAFLDNQPADSSQKEYFKFFGIPVPRGLTSGQAEQTIAEHEKSATSEQQQDWDGYSDILEEFDDSDFRETYDLKKVRKTVLLDAINQLRNEGKSYSYLADNIDEVVDKVIQLKPELEKQNY